MKLNIGVLFGGESVEHEVSIISAIQAINALDKERYNVVPIYLAKDKGLYSDPSLSKIDCYTDLELLKNKQPQVYFVKEKNKVFLKRVKSSLFSKPQPIDLVIPVVHGTNVEDGTVQGFLQIIGVPYSGCGVIAAGVGQDKVVMKNVLESNGLPLVDWTWFYYNDFIGKKEEYLKKVEKLGYPVIVKPSKLGSSVGIAIANNQEELISALEDAKIYDNKIVIEKVVKNLVEINASVLGDVFDARVSVLEKVGGSDEFLSYNDKYQGGSKDGKGMASTQRVIPAPLSVEKTSEIQALALKTFKVLEAAGVSRIDFMLDADTDKVYVNEINTIPGSLSFYLWEASGMSFLQLMDNLIRQAINRQRREEKMIFSYQTNILENFSRNGSKGMKK